MSCQRVGDFGLIARDHFLRRPERNDTALVDPHRAIAERLYGVQIVRNQYDGYACSLKIRDAGKTFFLKFCVAHCQHLVDKKDIRLDMDRDRESEANLHSGGIGLEGLVDERT